MYGKVSPAGQGNRNHKQEDFSLDKMDLDRKDDDNGDYYNTMLNKNVLFYSYLPIESRYLTLRK